VIQKSPDGPEGEDDKVYFFFTEVSVEYEFVFKLMIPRVARVCKVGAVSLFPPTVLHDATPRFLSGSVAISYG
jgi:hypothetical protein